MSIVKAKLLQYTLNASKNTRVIKPSVVHTALPTNTTKMDSMVNQEEDLTVQPV